MNAADFYRAIWFTLWRLNERHDLRWYATGTPGAKRFGGASGSGARQRDAGASAQANRPFHREGV